jgi:hypothetical protein
MLLRISHVAVMLFPFVPIGWVCGCNTLRAEALSRYLSFRSPPPLRTLFHINGLSDCSCSIRKICSNCTPSNALHRLIRLLYAAICGGTANFFCRSACFAILIARFTNLCLSIVRFMKLHSEQHGTQFKTSYGRRLSTRSIPRGSPYSPQ